MGIRWPRIALVSGQPRPLHTPAYRAIVVRASGRVTPSCDGGRRRAHRAKASRTSLRRQTVGDPRPDYPDADGGQAWARGLLRANGAFGCAARARRLFVAGVRAAPSGRSVVGQRRSVGIPIALVERGPRWRHGRCTHGSPLLTLGTLFSGLAREAAFGGTALPGVRAARHLLRVDAGYGG